MNKLQKGQSLMELLIAMGVFVMIISAIIFLIIDSYTIHRLGREETIAVFLAEEGLEAVRSIRDSNWNDLQDGNYGLAISGRKWIFQGSEEDLSDALKQGKRVITISTIDADKKEIKSKITWEFKENRSQEIILITYLTNWVK